MSPDSGSERGRRKVEGKARRKAIESPAQKKAILRRVVVEALHRIEPRIFQHVERNAEKFAVCRMGAGASGDVESQARMELFLTQAVRFDAAWLRLFVWRNACVIARAREQGKDWACPDLSLLCPNDVIATLSTRTRRALTRHAEILVTLLRQDQSTRSQRRVAKRFHLSNVMVHKALKRFEPAIEWINGLGLGTNVSLVLAKLDAQERARRGGIRVSLKHAE